MKFLTMGIIFLIIAMWGYENMTLNDRFLVNCNNNILYAINVTNLVHCAFTWTWNYNFVIFALVAVVCFIKCRPHSYGKRKVMKFD